LNALISEVTEAVERPAGVIGERLAQVLGAIADGVTVQDRAGRVVYANEAALRTIGFASLTDLLAATNEEILDRFDLFDDAGRPLSAAVLPGRIALTGTEPPPLRVRFRVRASGEDRWAIVRATPLRNDAGEVEFAINTFHDVTALVEAESGLRRSEERFRSLLTATSHVIWTAAPDGRMVEPQPAWEAFTGQSEDEYRDLGWLTAIHPDDRERRARQVAERTQDPSFFETSYRLRRRDGEYRRVLVRGLPLLDPDGVAREYVGTVTDVEDERRAIERLELLVRASEALEASLDLHQTVRAAAEVVVPAVADWCTVDLVAEDGRRRRAASVRDRRVAARARKGDGDQAAALAEAAIREGRSVLGPPAAEAPAVPGDDPAAVAAERSRAIATPLRARDEVLGALVLVRDAGRPGFDNADIDLIGELAGRVSLAMSNASLYGEAARALAAARRATARTERLRVAGTRLADARSQQEVAGIAAEEAREATAARRVYVALVRDQHLEAAVVEGYPDEFLEPHRRIPLDADHPLAAAARSGQPQWIEAVPDWAQGEAAVRDTARTSGDASTALLPLSHEGRIVGLLTLTWLERHHFDDTERSFLLALGGQLAQAIIRVGLREARELLFADLEVQRSRLEAVMRQMPGGLVIAEAPSGRFVYANEQATAQKRMAIEDSHNVGEFAGFVAFHPDGRRYEAVDWPTARAIEGEVVNEEEIEVVFNDGSRGIMSISASPIRDRSGAVTAAVVTFRDVTAQRRAEADRMFLSEAATILASSLDFEANIERVAELAVARIADACLVEVLDDRGALREIGLAHRESARLERLRRTLTSRGRRSAAKAGVWRVMRSGDAQVVTDAGERAGEGETTVDRGLLRAFGARSYLVVPLVWEGRTLGAMTLVGGESGRRYGEADLPMARELAERSAAAIQRGRHFRDADRFRRMLDAIADVTVTIDPTTLQLTYVNQGAIDQLGFSRDELLAKRITDIAIDLDDAAFRSIAGPLLDRTAESRTTTQAFRSRDGRSIPVEVLLQPVRTGRDPMRILAVARDVSDRVEAQSRLQRMAEAEHARAAELNAVLRALGDGVFVCAPDGRIRLANPAAEATFPDIEERTYGDLLDQLEDPDGAAPELGSRGGPLELRTRDGVRWIELSTYPVESRRSPGHEIETIVMLRDVTAARERQQVRDTFVGILSHELRTPVTTIYAGAKVLARTSPTISAEVRQSVFEDIHAEAERLHRLVEDVVALTRFGEDDAEIGQEPVLLQRILPTVVRSEETRWPGVEFRLEVPPGLATVSADPTYVEQVVRNLLSNAAKYGPARGPVVVTADGGAGEVRVRISDRGPGFPSDEADRLFELFYRSPSTSSAAAGAGIGLYVCSRLIQAMGGRIWARSEPDGGAEFGFALRVMNEDD
jgi:PAS domain S-box-containing protein